MKKNDRVIHNKFGAGTVIDVRLYSNLYPYLIRFDNYLTKLIWCSENEIEKIKVFKIGGII